MTSPKRHLIAVESVFGVYLSEDDLRGLEEHIECLESKAQDLAESNKDLRYLLILMAFVWVFTALFFLDQGFGYYALIPTLFAGLCLFGGFE